MTIGELIEQLKGKDPELEVFGRSPYPMEDFEVVSIEDVHELFNSDVIGVALCGLDEQG